MKSVKKQPEKWANPNPRRLRHQPLHSSQLKLNLVDLKFVTYGLIQGQSIHGGASSN